MKLVINGEIHFRDIGFTMPVGVVEGVSREVLFFAKEVCNAGRRNIVFADMRNHPEYNEHSLITPVTACCYHPRNEPYVLICIRPEECTDTIVIHELMHAWLFFTEGYDDTNRLCGDHPFHIRLFAGRVGNIASDLHVNASMRRRGFEIASLRESSLAFLDECGSLIRRPEYATEPGMQWQIGSILGHLCAGKHIYHFTNRNRRFLDGFERLCRRRAPGVLYCRDLIADTVAKTGYDTTGKVARFVDIVVPKLFEFLREEFKGEYLRTTAAPSPDRSATSVQGCSNTGGGLP